MSFWSSAVDWITGDGSFDDVLGSVTGAESLMLQVVIS